MPLSSCPSHAERRIAIDEAGVGRSGFSLVEILIALMILCVGLVMVAGAFPVGLHFFQASVDETIAALLARSTLSDLQTMRTRAYEANEQQNESLPRAERYAQAAVVECFRTDTQEVVYLWDAANHRGGGGQPGQYLTEQGLGEDINEWMPREERVSGVDARFGCQVFYKFMEDPLGGAPSRVATYQVFVLVQKSPEGMNARSWDDRFPAPSAPTTVVGLGTSVDWPASSSFVVTPGAFLVNVDNANWARVVEVNGAKLTLNRSLGGTRVRAVNNGIAMFRGVVSKEALR